MSTQRLIVLSEHLNATYWINFGPLVERAVDGWRASGLDAERFESDPSVLTRAIAADATGDRVAALVISRYHGVRADDAIRSARLARLPVYFHLDDWLFDLPPEIGSAYAQRYGADSTERLARVIVAVDAVWCSTPRLQQQLLQRFPAVRTRVLVGVCYRPVPRGRFAWRSRLARLRAVTFGRPVVGYAGTTSHVADLQLLVPTLERLLSRRTDLRFECLGLPVPPPLRDRFGARVASHGFTRDYDGYLRSLYESGWTLALCPLRDNVFNRCKTATKLVEYTACGIPALCSDLETYRQAVGDDAAASLVGNEAQWESTLDAWLDDPGLGRSVLGQLQRRFAESASPAAAAHAVIECLEAGPRPSTQDAT